jgi:hypothetical protein
MSQPVLDLQNSQKWGLVWGASFVAAKDAKGNNIEIPPIAVPVRIESSIVAVFASSPTGRQSWKIAGTVARRIRAGVSGTDGADVVSNDARLIRLNQFTLFRFVRLTTDYELTISPKWWLPDISVSVYEYIGIDSDTTTEALAEIRDLLEELA